MLLNLFAIAVGFGFIIWSADKFVDGASALAKHLGLSSMLIGVVVVGFGTSAPELIVSVTAALEGSPGLAFGNAVGSNIVNIGIILGVTAILSPIMVNSSVVKKEMPILILVCLFSGLIFWDLKIERFEGFLFLLGLVIFLATAVFWNRTTKTEDPIAHDVDIELSPLMPLSKSILWVVVGLVFLVGSSRLLVWGAVNIAEFFGISELIIGLTLVAFGTSLPELMASIMSVRKNEHDLALGNVIGSNLFNLLGVVGLAAAISPFDLEHQALVRDWPVMMGMTLLLLACCLPFKKKPIHITRLEGLSFVLLFTGYTTYLILTNLGPAV
jgi:cation:H+ antiporter